MIKMAKRCSFTLFALSIAVLFLFSCSTGDNPFQQSNATINVNMQNSGGHQDPDTISDTVGNLVRVGLTGYLPSYITSAKVLIGAGADTDTTITYPGSTAWANTQWIAIEFRSAGTRTVTVTVYLGSQVKTITATIIVLGKQVGISTQPKSLAVDPNGAALFFVVPKDAGTFTYQWVKDGTPISGATKDSLLIDTVRIANAGVYTCVVKDRWGDSVVSNPAVLTINPPSNGKTPPVVMVPVSDTAASVAQGMPISFVVSAVTSAGDTATLSAALVDGAKLPDSAVFSPTTGQFTWTPTFGESGVYSIVFTATSPNGVGKDTVKITVTKTDRPPVVQAQSVNTSISQVIAVSLSATDSDNDSIKQWQVAQKPHNGTATFADSTKGSVVYTPTTGFAGVDTFAVKASDGTLWSASANIIVTVSSVKLAPKITTQPRTDTTVTAGGTAGFTVAINNASPSPTFIWYKGTKGGTANVTKDSSTNAMFQITNVAAADSGNYFVVVINSTGTDTSAYAHLAVNVPPSTPTLSAPANNATGIALSPALTWSTVTGAATYRVQVSTASDFSTGIVVDDSTLTAATKAVTGLTNNTQYYWRVNAKNADGTSAWSTAFNFTTIVAASGVPVLSAPSNSATGVALNPALTWSAVTGAATYRVQVSTASDFSTGIVADDSTLTAATKALSGLSNSTQYYWRVDAKNAGGTSAWSTAFSFTTVVAVSGVPVPTSPSNGATGVALAPALTWSTVTGAATYSVQVSTASDFSTGIVADDSTLTAATKALTGLANSTQYYWRVNAKNAGGTSVWSSVSSFTTIVAIPGVPTLTAPANNATGVALTPNLTWGSVTGAVSYEVQVSTSTTFATTVFDLSGITVTTQAITPALANGTVYYWRANATNAGGASGWTAAMSFTTIVAAPSAPVLTAPASGATGVAVSPTLSWTAATGAASYEVQVSTSSAFTTTVFDQAGITATSQAVTPALANGTVYYWRANATNAGGTSGWTAAMSFTTIVAAPSAPTLSTPSNTATNVSLTPTLTWSTVANAASYQIQVSTVSNFASTVFTASGLTATTQAISPALSNSTQYYWRVNATNAGGTGGWSSTFSFTTVPPAPAAPTLSSPANGATGVAASPTVSWAAVSGASSYEVQISTSSTFATTVFDKSGVTSTSQAVTPALSNKTTYYWRVNATNAGGTSAWSGAWSFATIGTISWNALYNFQTLSTYPMTVVAKGDTILVGTHKKGVFRSPDNGSNWVQDPSNVTIGMNYLTGAAVLGGRSFVGNNYGNGNLFYSADYGNSWSSVSVGGSVLGFAYYSVTNRYFAATSGGVMYSTDNGVSWNFDGGTLSSANAVLVSGTTLYAGTSDGVQSRSVLGYSWSASGTGIPSGDAVNVLVLYGGSVYAGAADGVYKFNGTDTWTKMSSGLPSGAISSLAANGSYIFAGTQNYGVYMSADGGASWSAVNTGFPSGSWYVSGIALNGSNIYAVSSGDYNVYGSTLP
jgi:hypothetical protein